PASNLSPLACAEPNRPIASLVGISKRFGPLRAVDDVSIHLQRGRVVGIVGENGAGKTTAMNILAGIYVPDTGAVMIDDAPLLLGSPMHAVAAGVGMVHQHFKLVETLTGAANVSLALDRGRFLQPSLVGAAVEQLMRELGFEIDLAARVWQMPLSQRQ